MNLSELFKIALKSGEDKALLNKTLNPLRRAGTQHILRPRYGILTFGSLLNASEEEHNKWLQLRRDMDHGKIDVTVEDILEAYPDYFERLRIREFGPKKEEYFMYLLERYYQPSKDIYERRDTYGGEYDI